MNVIGITTAGN